MMLLKRVCPSARAGLAEGPPEVGWGQEGNVWGNLYNYYYITIVMKNRAVRREARRCLLII
jgi:hypothetical protein